MNTHIEDVPVRRRFRWRLRTLMGLVLVCALASGVIVAQLRRIGARRAAVAAVYESGGMAFYDYQWMTGGPYTLKWTWAPAWLRTAVGDVVFHDVTQLVWLGTDPKGKVVPSRVTDKQTAVFKAFPRLGSVLMFDAPGVTDQTLEHLAGVSELSKLALFKVKITDDGLAHLKGLKSLEMLDLRSVPITDRGLSNLAGLDLHWIMLMDCPINGAGLKTLGTMPGLGYLWLENVGVTDDSLAALRQIPSLEYLTLAGTQTTDRGLEHVAALKGLRSLTLGRENSSDEGVARIKGLMNLTTLSLKGPRVTNTAVKDLVAIKSLVRLDLVESNLTDDGIKALAGLPFLQYLDLTGSRVSDEGVEALRALRPGLNVTFPGTSETVK